MVIVTYFIIGQSIAPKMRSSLEERGQALISATHYASETMTDPADLQRFISALAAEDGVEYLGIITGSPPIIVASNRGAWRKQGLEVLPPNLRIQVDRALNDQATEPQWVTRNAESIDVVSPLRIAGRSLGDRDRIGAAFARLDSSPVLSAVNATSNGLAWLLLAFTASFGFLALFLVHRKILRPLDSLGRTMARRASGDQFAFAPRLTEDELGDLAQQLDTMLHALDSARDEVQIANRSKTDFLANMSHEIRTPMTAILGFTDSLLDPQTDRKESEEGVRTIQRNCLHLLQLLDDILDVSKIEAGRVEVEMIDTPLPQLLVDLRSLLLPKVHEKSLAFALTFENPIPLTISTDATRLKQVLLNLIGNAIKFTDQGRIELRASLIEDGAEPRLTFEVEDTGIGMTPQQCEHIFAPFAQADESTTRKFGGTGLGLTISRSLAELLGGSLTVRSEEGKGSVFCLEIPAHFDPAGTRVHDNNSVSPSTFVRKPQVEIPTLGIRVLIAEDGLDNQLLIGRLMERAGCTVTIVNNGLKAVEAIEGARDAFDLVLMDMQMPEMDGYTATRMLRELGCELPIVALTAHAMTGDREKCLRAGCSGYATKPIDRTDLFSTIRSLLGDSIPS